MPPRSGPGSPARSRASIPRASSPPDARAPQRLPAEAARDVPLSEYARLCAQNDVTGCERACDGAKVLIHLAAIPDEDEFYTKLLPFNLEGVYNAFEAARQACDQSRTCVCRGRTRQFTPPVVRQNPVYGDVSS